MLRTSKYNTSRTQKNFNMIMLISLSSSMALGMQQIAFRSKIVMDRTLASSAAQFVKQYPVACALGLAGVTGVVGFSIGWYACNRYTQDIFQNMQAIIEGNTKGSSSSSSLLAFENNASFSAIGSAPKDSRLYAETPTLQKILDRHVGVSETQGHRTQMEDAHYGDINRDHAFFALCDGHGGKAAADLVSRRLHPIFFSRLASDNISVEKALEYSFETIHAMLDPVLFAEQGTTALVAFLKEGKLLLANAGDSRAVLCSGGCADQLTMDHKVSDAIEMHHMQERTEGNVKIEQDRINGKLDVTRALGDKEFGQAVTCVPETFSRTIKPEDEFLILASDGVWDVINNQTAVGIVKLSLEQYPHDFTMAAHTLRDEALRSQSKDNITVMIIDLKPFHSKQ